MKSVMNMDIKKTHNELIEMIFYEYEKSVKRKYISLFLSSLGSNNLSHRGGLAVLAILQTFPRHYFTADSSGLRLDNLSAEDKKFAMSKIPCEICSDYATPFSDDSLIEDFFHNAGGVVGHDLKTYHYYLAETNKLEEISPKGTDFYIFSEIIKILTNAAPEETAKTVQSKISKIKGFRSNAEQRRLLLETLGYCGILETENAKGLLNTYTNLAIAPRKTHNSDWNYPVDFWTGKNGINKTAMDFWFGDYPELDSVFD